MSREHERDTPGALRGYRERARTLKITGFTYGETEAGKRLDNLLKVTQLISCVIGIRPPGL